MGHCRHSRAVVKRAAFSRTPDVLKVSKQRQGRPGSKHVYGALCASGHARSDGGKPWPYAWFPHNVVADNTSLEFLMTQFVRGLVLQKIAEGAE